MATRYNELMESAAASTASSAPASAAERPLDPAIDHAEIMTREKPADEPPVRVKRLVKNRACCLAFGGARRDEKDEEV